MDLKHVDFTREPIIETIITPKDGCKLVIRSSKSTGQEEYFVDALEVVSFGHSLFYRSIERPKAFLVPAADYEVLEVRETRMILKNVGVERTIKIGGGRESAKTAREASEKLEPATIQPEPVAAPTENLAPVLEGKGEVRLDKKRDKRRQYRRRRGREEGAEEGAQEGEDAREKEDLLKVESPLEPVNGKGEKEEPAPGINTFISPLLPPPPTLISESIARYRQDALFKGAFFVKDSPEEEGIHLESVDHTISEEQLAEEHSEEVLEALDMQNISLEPSAYGSFNVLEEDEEIPLEESILFYEEPEEKESSSILPEFPSTEPPTSVEYPEGDRRD